MSGWNLETLLCGRADRVLLLVGPALVLDLGTALAGRAALGGHRVLYLDGANAFDPYIPARMAREAGLDPRPVLDRLFVSRAFTCHQLETLMVDRLDAAIRARRPGLVVVSGWSHLFHDENVPFREALRLLEATAGSVRRLAARGTPFLATHEDGPRTPRLRPLAACLERAATAVIRVDRNEGLIRLTAAKGPAALPPLLMDEAGLVGWLGRPTRPRNDL
ncbi:MAG TPA: hypothetical protein VIG69_03700 [Candidatus Methylomirabilis sp.]